MKATFNGSMGLDI